MGIFTEEIKDTVGTCWGYGQHNSWEGVMRDSAVRMEEYSRMGMSGWSERGV